MSLPLNESSGEQSPCGQLECPPGFTLVGDNCQLIEEEAATYNPTQVYGRPGSNNNAYGDGGARVFELADGFNLPLKGISGQIYDNGSANPNDYPNTPWQQGTQLQIDTTLTTANVWKNQSNNTGRLNEIGLWASQTPGGGIAAQPVNEWIGFTVCIDVPETKVYWLGIAADNRFRFKINGTKILEMNQFTSTHHYYWYIVPLTLQQGQNIIEMTGLNDGSAAAFGAEIYDPPGANFSARQAALYGVTTVQEIEDMVVWNTYDELDELFSVGGETIPGWDENDAINGELSGASCPQGFTLSPTGCTTGECVRITYEPIEEVECCNIIRNCQDENEIYNVQFAESETNPLYQNNVFRLAGNQTLFDDKCFELLGLTACETPDVVNVTVVEDLGPSASGGCNACDPSLKLDSCLDPGNFLYITLAAGQPALSLNNVYEFDAFEGCYTYEGEDTENTRDHDGVSITVDHSSQDCLICVPCQQFTNCETQEQITVLLDDWQNANANVPQGPNIVHLSSEDNDWTYGDPCWQYDGSIPCAGQTISFSDVVITDVSPCTDCASCDPHYMLTDCANPNNTMEITWPQGEDPLDTTQTYVFDFDAETCWTAAYLPPLDDECQQALLVAAPEYGPWVACAYSMLETNDFVDNIGGQAGNTWEYEMLSCIVDGVEYINGAPETWQLSYTVDGTAGLTQLNYNSSPFNLTTPTGFTYRDQADGMNAIFASLGVDDRLVAQTITQGGWAGMGIYGGIYIIRNTTFSITISDNSGHIKILSDDGYCIDAVESNNVNTNFSCADYDLTGQNPNTLADYEYYRCTNTQEVPSTFPVELSGQTQTPYVDEPPLLYE